MAATITEVKDPDAVTLGLGVLGMAAYPTGSPGTFTDVGYLKGFSVAYTRELKEFESAGLLIKRLAFRDRLSLRATWAEVSLDNLEKVIQGTRAGNTHRFGGDRSISRYALRFEHTRDDDEIITVEVYKSVAASDFELAFAEEEFITYPVEFSAEADTSRTTGQQYGYIKIAA